ncbi:MAG: hypothetical protein HPY85_14280 [Anaerolineae bacterium]|nr:hypothetical protein [Anaerolineae bacterium]
MGERKSWRIEGLANVVAGLHGLLLREAQEGEPDFLKLHTVFQKEASSLSRALHTAGIQPGNLPTRSMRAAAWILFLRDMEQLHTHFIAVKRMVGLLNQAGFRHYDLNFSYSAYLFRYSPRKTGLQVSFHEGFINAPLDIHQALAQTGAGGRGRSAARDRVRQHTQSHAFRAVKDALEEYSRAVFVAADAQGQHFDLKAAFERVNWAYFAGKQALPHLCWSGSHNYRKLGHYNPVSDTIQVSSSLDQPGTPEYVLDFILYHELLHRDLGIVEQNQRQLAHRAEFRRHEQDFAHYDEARFFLQELAARK